MIPAATTTAITTSTTRMPTIARTRRALRLMPFPFVMQEAEEYRNKEERRHGCEQKTANNRPAERRVLFTALTDTQRHRQHADNHRQRGHQHWTKTSVACKHGGIARRVCVGKLLLRKADHQNTVGGSHTHTHDGAGESRNADGCVRHKQEPNDTRQSRG